MSVRDMAMTFEAVQSYMRKDVKGVNLTLVIHPDDVPEGQKAVSQAGLLCREKSFWAFLGVFTEEEAVKELKARLDIISRSELANNKIAREGFRELVNEFNRSY